MLKALLQKRGPLLRAIARYLPLTIALGLAAGLLISAIFIWAFAELIDEVLEGESQRFDTYVLLWINSTFPEWLEAPMRFVTALGYYWVVLLLLPPTTYAFYRTGRKFSAALLAVSTLGSILLTTVLKDVFERTRPELFESSVVVSSYSFPSGHATVAVGFYGTVTLLLAWHLGGPWRWVVVAAGTAIILLIGFSRLYLGVHYPTDIIAGFLASAVWISTVGTALFLWRFIRKTRLDRTGNTRS